MSNTVLQPVVMAGGAGTRLQLQLQLQPRLHRTRSAWLPVAPKRPRG